VNRLLAAVVCVICIGSVKAFAEEPKSETKPASTAPAADAVKAQAGCSHCTFNSTTQCMPAIKIGDTVYIVKVADQASEQTRKLVASLPQMKGDAKNVKLVGKPVPAEEAKKAAEVAKSENKNYYEIGEMSLQE
jgi:hypothetical protein